MTKLLVCVEWVNDSHIHQVLVVTLHLSKLEILAKVISLLQRSKPSTSRPHDRSPWSDTANACSVLVQGLVLIQVLVEVGTLLSELSSEKKQIRRR